MCQPKVDYQLCPLHSNLAEIHVLLSGKIESDPDSLNKMQSQIYILNNVFSLLLKVLSIAVFTLFLAAFRFHK